MSIGDTLLSRVTPPQPAKGKTPANKVQSHTRFRFPFTSRLNILTRAMRATIYSEQRGHQAHPEECPLSCNLTLAPGFGRVCGFVAFASIFLFTCLAQAQSGPGPADPKAPPDAQFAGRAEKAFTAAKANYLTNSNDPDACLQFVRATFDWADYATSDSKRADIAEQGISASRKFIQFNSNNAAAHYYLAMNLGELARTKSWGALKIVNEMEEEFNLTLKLDAKFDHSGADRGLGLLYLDTPGWPLSIGSKTKARQHLQKALKDAPDYPENHLNMIEADLKWGDKKPAATDLKALADIWADARAKFTGDPWAASWADWTKRRAAAEKKAGVKPVDGGSEK